MALPNNYSIEELGIGSYALMNSAHMLVNWAVPVFFMISGMLLIPKYVTYKKVVIYVTRMVLVLTTFGVVFSFIELVFNGFPISVLSVGRSILLTLQGKTWNHMWYVYALIGIYLVLIPLSRGLQSMSVAEIRCFTATLVIGHCFISSINASTSLSLETYMQFTNQIMWFVLGYYVTVEPLFTKIRRPLSYYLVFFVGGGIVKFTLMWFWIHRFGQTMPFLTSLNLLDLVQAVSLFLLVKAYSETEKHNKINSVVISISRCSFAIYVIHPVYGNFFYKVLGFTPLAMPLLIGIPVVTVSLFLLSWGTAVILVRLPITSKIL